jgi:acyl carrier protein
MNVEDIYFRLTDIFQDVFDDELLKLSPELTAEDVDGWDSLAHIRLVLMVEKEFSVKFSAGEVGKLKNVGEFADLIRAKLKI